MIETLFTLLRDSGHDPSTMVRASSESVNLSTWSGPGEIEQWPGLQLGGLGGAPHVNEHTALNYASVYASVRILSSIDAALPFHLRRDLPGGGVEKVTTDYRYKLIHDRPNKEMGAPMFRLYMRQNRLLWGNAYAWIQWGLSGRADAIWPMRPDWMSVYRKKNGDKVYHYDPPDKLRAGYFSPDEILHYRGLGDDLVGYSPIRLARAGIGLGMAAVTFGSNFFSNGARPSGILEVQGKIDPKVREKTEKDFADKYASASNAGKTLIVDQGSKFTSTTIPPDDAQYLETRMFQGGEISSKIYGIPPHLTGDTEKQSSWGTGVEQMSIGFVTYTLMPESALVESEINIKLLGDGLYCKQNLDALLRADYKSRQEGLQVQRRNGIINADEWRDREDLNPIAGGLGLTYICEANMTTLEMVGTVPPTAPKAPVAA